MTVWRRGTNVSRRHTLPVFLVSMLMLGVPVIGGTLNQTGSFLRVADTVGKDTVLSRIIGMVADAQRSRTPIQKVADAVAGYFEPAVLAIAVITFLVWAIAAPKQPPLAWALVNAVAMLIIACPCALGLRPAGRFLGIGGCTGLT